MRLRKLKKNHFFEEMHFLEYLQTYIYIYTHNIYLYIESVWKLEVDQTVIPKRERRDYSSWSRKRLLKIIGNPFRSGISPLGGLTDRGGFNGFGKKKKEERKKRKKQSLLSILLTVETKKSSKIRTIFFFFYYRNIFIAYTSILYKIFYNM